MGDAVGVTVAESSRMGGDVEDLAAVSKLGGRRFVALVGKGKAGGASDDSGRSAIGVRPLRRISS